MKKNIFKCIIVFVTSVMLLSACSGLMPGGFDDGGSSQQGGGTDDTPSTSTDLYTNFSGETFTYEQGATTKEVLFVSKTSSNNINYVQVNKIDFTYDTSAFSIDYSIKSDFTVDVSFVKCDTVGTFRVNYVIYTDLGSLEGRFRVVINRFNSELYVTGISDSLPINQSITFTASREDGEDLNLMEDSVTITTGRTSYFYFDITQSDKNIKFYITAKNYPLEGMSFLFEFSAKTIYGQLYHGTFAFSVTEAVEYQYDYLVSADEVLLKTGDVKNFTLNSPNDMYGNFVDQCEFSVNTPDGEEYDYKDNLSIKTITYSKSIEVQIKCNSTKSYKDDLVLSFSVKTSGYYYLTKNVEVHMIDEDAVNNAIYLSRSEFLYSDISFYAFENTEYSQYIGNIDFDNAWFSSDTNSVDVGFEHNVDNSGQHFFKITRLIIYDRPSTSFFLDLNLYLSTSLDLRIMKVLKVYVSETDGKDVNAYAPDGYDNTILADSTGHHNNYEFRITYDPSYGYLTDYYVEDTGSPNVYISRIDGRSIYIVIGEGYLNANETFDIRLNAYTDLGYHITWQDTFHIYWGEIQVNLINGDAQGIVGNTNTYEVNLFSRGDNSIYNYKIDSSSFSVASKNSYATVSSFQITDAYGNITPRFELTFMHAGTAIINIFLYDIYGNCYSFDYTVQVVEGSTQGQTITMNIYDELPSPFIVSHTGSNGSYNFTLFVSESYGEIINYQTYYVDNTQGILTSLRSVSGSYYFDININISDVVNTDRENGFTIYFQANTNYGNSLVWSHTFDVVVATADYNCTSTGADEEVFVVGNELTFTGGIYFNETRYDTLVNSAQFNVSDESIATITSSSNNSFNIQLLSPGTFTLSGTVVDTFGNVHNFSKQITVYDSFKITETSLYNPLPQTDTGNPGTYSFTLSFPEDYGSIDYAYVTYGDGSSITGLDSSIEGNNNLVVRFPASTGSSDSSFTILVTGRMSNGREFSYTKIFDVYKTQVACTSNIDTENLHVGDEINYGIFLVMPSIDTYLSNELIANITVTPQNGKAELIANSGSYTFRMLEVGSETINVQITDIFGNTYSSSFVLNILG